MNCPNCGAAVKEGKFCNYCGAKLPDDTKRVEVNINKKIEDVAEIKRASYEEQESQLIRKMMKRDLRRGKVKRIVLISYVAVTLILLLPSIINSKAPLTSTGYAGIAILILLIGFGMFYGIYKITH